jgi:hypothetical protein
VGPRQHHTQPIEDWHPPALHRRVVGHRADIKPHDLRSRDQEWQITMTRLKENSRRAVRGEIVFRTGAGGPYAGPGPVPAGLRPNMRRRRLGFAGSLAFARIFVFTHDAMDDGEDGPTHQPVEQLASFRAIPGLVMLRPADANEVVGLPLYHQAATRAGRPGVVAPTAADFGPQQICGRLWGCARRLCVFWSTPGGRLMPPSSFFSRQAPHP